MVQLLAGFQLSQALYAAAKLGVADQLSGGLKDATSLAAEVGADAQALRRLLRTLASIGVFTETEDERFGLTPLGETLTTDSPASMRDLAIRHPDADLDRQGPGLTGPAPVAQGQLSRLAKTLMATASMTAPNR
jgi:predicted transcriptional regulator